MDDLGRDVEPFVRERAAQQADEAFARFFVAARQRPQATCLYNGRRVSLDELERRWRGENSLHHPQ